MFDRVQCLPQSPVTSSTLSMATHLKNCLTSLRTLLHQVLQRPAEISCHPLCLPEEMLFLSFVVCYDSVLVTFDVIFLTAKKIKLVSSMLKQASQSGPQFIDKKNKQTVYIYFYALADAFIQSNLQAIHIFISMCVPWELNPQPFALLTQCSTTEPQEQSQ